MKTIRLLLAVAVMVVAICGWQGCAESTAPTSSSAIALTTKNQESSPATSTSEAPAARGYDNGVNRLIERQITVKDNKGNPARRHETLIGTVDLKIVWTYTTEWGWNYCLPEFPGGKEAFKETYPSTPLYLERKVAAQTVLHLEIPETPYSFCILNGGVAPYFIDSKKSVIWHLGSTEVEKTLHGEWSISTSSKVMKLGMGGGDMASFFVVDFSDPQESPSVTYYEEYHGF